MLKTFYVSASPLAKVAYSPDGRYLAVSESGVLNLFELSGSIVLKVDFPFDVEPIDLSFNFDDDQGRTTEIALLYEEGLFRCDFARPEKVEVYQFTPEVACSCAYGAGSIYVGTEGGCVLRIELENDDHPITVDIGVPIRVSVGAIVMLRPTFFYDEGANIYDDSGELLFYSRLNEELFLIEPPVFQSTNEARWSLIGFEYCRQLAQRSYSGWSSSGAIYLGSTDYSLGLRLTDSGASFSNDAQAQILSALPLSESEYLIATTSQIFKLTVKRDETQETASVAEYTRLSFTVIYEVERDYRILAAYQLANSSIIHIVKTTL